MRRLLHTRGLLWICVILMLFVAEENSTVIISFFLTRFFPFLTFLVLFLLPFHSCLSPYSSLPSFLTFPFSFLFHLFFAPFLYLLYFSRLVTLLFRPLIIFTSLFCLPLSLLLLVPLFLFLSIYSISLIYRILHGLHLTLFFFL